jgi:hypothetical protein
VHICRLTQDRWSTLYHDGLILHRLWRLRPNGFCSMSSLDRKEFIKFQYFSRRAMEE